MRASDIENNEDVKDDAVLYLEKKFNLTTDQLKKVSELLQDEMKASLISDNSKSDILMLPSWITSHPSGQEKGEYLGLDLSGKS